MDTCVSCNRYAAAHGLGERTASNYMIVFAADDGNYSRPA